MSQDPLNPVYNFSYAEMAKTFLIMLSKQIEVFSHTGLNQQITAKDHLKRIYELFENEMRRAAQLSEGIYLKNAYERLEESKNLFQNEEIEEALLKITKAISEATTQAARSLEVIEKRQ